MDSFVGGLGPLCAMGLVLGVIGLGAAHRFDVNFARIGLELACCAAGYLAACGAVCVLCSVAVSARKPLELLQARE